jgi:hypothetical protein
MPADPAPELLAGVLDLFRRRKDNDCSKEGQMASRSEKLRRRQHRKEKKRQRTHQSASEFGLPRRDTVIVNPPGAAKMSEVLWALVEPDLDTSADEEDMRRLLSLGVIAWNVALLKGAERTKELDSLAQKFPGEQRQAFYQVIDPLIRRKEEQFPHIQRPIVDFDLTWQASGRPFLSVISGLE